MGVVLKVCVNGARRRHDRVPTTPVEVAASAAGAVAAGAEAVHVHPRDDDGVQTLDADLVSRTVAAVRAAVPGVPVGVSTHAGIVPDPVRRLALVAAWPAPHDGGPDFASVNWHETGATELARALRTRLIGVEAGLWTPSAAAAFVGTRWPWQVLRVLVEAIPGHSPGAEGPWSAGRILAALGQQPAPVLVHGEEHWTWPVLRWAQRQGYDTRIGLEDTLHDEQGRRVEANADLVRPALEGRP
ncbi:MAG: 3-keto-5-aminohexanoate cleavage protein [Lapillicoccus sp.]